MPKELNSESRKLSHSVSRKVRYLDTSGPSMAKRSTRPWERRRLLSTDWDSRTRYDNAVVLCVTMTGRAVEQRLHGLTDVVESTSLCNVALRRSSSLVPFRDKNWIARHRWFEH